VRGARQGMIYRAGASAALEIKGPPHAVPCEQKRRLSAFTQALADFGWTNNRIEEVCHSNQGCVLD
jgi:hypothetical protein